MDERPGRPSWFRDKRSERWGLGDAIRTRREEVKLSRRDLAERAGLSYPYLSELETGKKRGSPDSIRSVADALGLGQDELWARADALAGAALEAFMAAPPAPAAKRMQDPPPPAPMDLAQRVADALAGATPAEAEAALLMALGELRYRQAAPPRKPDGRFG
jgi:transcriptional regulator with XRE-family HTH domain